MANDPWTFGWTQTLTIVGFLITILIAMGGLRTFASWKREKLEERKIEIAFEGLALAYESKYVFDHIRSPMSFPYEWADMPRLDGETDEQWRQRSPYYAILKRVEDNKEFFERVYKLQPRCMAALGPDAEETFILLHRSRREIEVSSSMLARHINDDGVPNDRQQQMQEQQRADIWDFGDDQPELNRVGQKLRQFRARMEELCRPVIDRNYQQTPQTSFAAIMAKILRVG